MLDFNPDKRISCLEALSLPYFDDVRIKEQEEFDICEINLDFDEEELSPEEIRQEIVKELKSCSVNLDTFEWVHYAIKLFST